MTRPTLRTLAGTAALALIIGGAASANAATHTGQSTGNDGTLARTSTALTGTRTGSDVDKLKLNFPTYHTEGIAFTPDHIFLSAVQIIEPTVKYPTPQGGYDRTPGKGVGHLFVMDKAGPPAKGHHPRRGRHVPPRRHRLRRHERLGPRRPVPARTAAPSSTASTPTTLDVHKQFEVKDHFGGIVMDKQTGHLVGNTWGSRRFAEWDLQGQAALDLGQPQLLHRLPGLPVRPQLQDALRRESPTSPRPRPPAEPQPPTNSAAWP